MTETNVGQPELLVIRRRRSGEPEIPKGGVWKIAYADFMTAMMAFFLVMWLVAATSESTRTGVANYFNPIKLSEGALLPRKGLADPELIKPGATDPAGEEAHGKLPDFEDRGEEQRGMRLDPSRAKVTRYSEGALFRDPYAVLAAIAAEAGETISDLDRGGSEQNSGATGELDRIGNDPYRDPFDPPIRSLQTSGEASLSAEALVDAQARGAIDLAQKPKMPGAISEATFNVRAPDETKHMVRSTDADTGTRADDGSTTADDRKNTSFVQFPPGEPGMADQLLERLADLTLADPMPNVGVRRDDDGILISLHDQAAFAMFAIGSAEPLPETIAVMAKIAGVLKTVSGQVIIRGHTDGRPFRSEIYDNWRLSTARAHMAYYMLLRGGLDEKRVDRIEGYADRDLKVPSDPMAAENRRIEILVRSVG